MMKKDALPPEKEMQQKEYNEFVKQVTPTYSLAGNMAKAFVVGGVICCIGQAIINTAKAFGADEEMAPMWCTLGFSECPADRTQYLSDVCKMGRSRSTRADHRICQQRRSTGDRVSRQ